IRRSFHIYLRGFFSSITAHVAAASHPGERYEQQNKFWSSDRRHSRDSRSSSSSNSISAPSCRKRRQPPPLGLRPKSFDANLSDSVREGRPRHSCYRPFRSSPAWPARLSSRHRLRHGSKGLQWADGSSTFLGRALRRREGGGALRYVSACVGS